MWLILFKKIWPFFLRSQGIWVGVFPFNFNFWDLCKDIWLDTGNPPNTGSRFLCIYSLPAWRNLFSASGKVSAMLYWVSWLAEGTSQPVTISKSEKIPALLYVGERPEYRPFRDLQCVPKYSALLLYKNSSIRWTFLNMWVIGFLFRVLISLSCGTHVSEQVNTW